MNDTGTLAVFALAVLLLVVLTMQMDAATIALIGGIIVFFLVCKHKRRDDPGTYSMFNPAMMSSFDASAPEDGGSTMGPPADTTPIYSGKGANVDAIAALEKSQRPPAPVYSDPTDANRARISKSNALAIGELYGRRSAGTMDNAIYVHAQRIADRDRQATYNQIRSRRNNVYEPFYRQSLSEHASKRWWEPEDVLVTKLNKRQMDTIDMGRFSNEDSDLDGIYGQQ